MARQISTVLSVIESELDARTALSPPKVVGLSGPQGAGKTTHLTKILAKHGRRIAVLSLDDFYMPLKDRQRLARSVSPLFVTRGPPGTHDIQRLRQILAQLKSGQSVETPVFEKTIDDRLPDSLWRTVPANPEMILLEGWCIGAKLNPEFTSTPPINEVEHEDRDGAWRRYQSDALESDYEDLFSRMDAFVHLSAPSFETVLEWRTEQEATTQNVEVSSLSLASKNWVKRFIQHYERITRDMASGWRASGHVVELSSKREVLSVQQD